MITVVVPVKNEEENVFPLIKEIVHASDTVPVSEIIYVDDGSDDGTLAALKNARKVAPLLRIIRHDRACGQSAALWTGIKAAGNELIVTMDGDGQNNPADIEKLFHFYESLVNSNKHARLMIAGQREKRHDNFIRRLSSRIANGVRRFVLKDGTSDTGCSLKLFRRQDYLDLPYFNHMHRYLPALMARENVAVYHANVSHRPRERGVSKYGTLDRLVVGLSDLAGVRWLLNRARPKAVISEEND